MARTSRIMIEPRARKAVQNLKTFHAMEKAAPPSTTTAPSPVIRGARRKTRTGSRRPSSEETLARPAQQARSSPSSASSPVAKPNPSPPLSNRAPSFYLGLLLASLHPTLRWAKGCGEGRIGFLLLFLKRLVTDMGASLSNLTVDVGDGSGRPGLGDIPESCVACVFTYLTPPEICNLARLNRAFRGAASSDSVWELKLPPTYPQLVSLLPPDASLLSKKKDIFAFLSRPVPFDDRYKVLWLDRVTGGVCVSVSAKAMSITGIEDRRYWSWIPTQESRFQVVAFLQQIWWFEVQGLIKFPFPPGVYSLSFRLHLGKFFRRLGRRVCSYEQTHGWDLKPIRFDLSTSDGQNFSRECCLDEPESNNDMGFCKRGGWIDYLVGDFVVTGSETLDLRFSMKQIDCTHSKGGLCVDSVSIMPSELRDRKEF